MGPAASQLDLELSQKSRSTKGKPVKLSRGTRNNAQIVLRSVLRFAVKEGHLVAPPPGLPRLKRIGQTILEIPSDEQVQLILAKVKPCHRLSFALMAYAGLRPNEVRALRRRGMLLRREGGEPVGGFLSIREGLSFGQTDVPKTGQREIPVIPLLAQLLGPVEQGPRDGHIALTARGEPWGQYGLDQAFERARDRAKLTGWSIYALRHYAITLWLRRGVPVHVVQKMAGHSNLSTTQRYVHHLKSGLEDAARRLAGVGHRWAAQPA
jgi:integrase